MPRAQQNRRHPSGQAGITLIELLIAMIIMGIISTMLIVGWTAAESSVSYSVQSSEQRDFARLAVDRLAREIRDAEVPSNAYLSSAGLSLSTPAILRAREDWIVLFTTFNEGGSMPNVNPRVVVYRLYSDGSIWRYVDSNGDGQNGSLGTWADSVNALTNGTSSEATETSSWEGGQKVVGNVVNASVADSNAGTSTTDLFRYSTYDDSGALVQQSPVLGDDYRSGIVAVQVHCLVDLNPGHSPSYIDLVTSAQLRNAQR